MLQQHTVIDKAVPQKQVETPPKEGGANAPAVGDAERLQQLRSMPTRTPEQETERLALEAKSAQANARGAWGDFGGLNKPAGPLTDEQKDAATQA